MFGQGVYSCPTAPCAENSKKEFAEYNLELHTERGGLDHLGKLKKWVGRQYTHRPHIEYFWTNFDDDHEVRRRYYMRIRTKNFNSIDFFLVPN